MTQIDIYSLGEKDVFWAVIHNFLGWAHECTYGLRLEPYNYNPEERYKELLRDVVKKGGTLHISHLFKPFVDSDMPQYQRKFFDNGIRLIRLIVKTEGLIVDWDINDTEKDVLQRFSPPLYDRIFGDA